MPGLRDLFRPQRQLLQQQREISQLKKQVSELRARNDSMREGMRRCVSCEYRIEFKNRQGQAPVDNTPKD